MVESECENCFQSPKFMEAMRQFQSGQYQDGLTSLAEVEHDYPLDAAVRTLRQEMQIRSRIDEYEKEDRSRELLKKLLHYGIRILVLALVIAGIVWGATNYYSLLQQRWQRTLNSFNTEVQGMELAVKYRNAQDLLQAGRANEALQMFQEIAATNPDMEGLDTYIEQAEALVALEDQYAQALQLLEDGDQQAALEIFKAIEVANPLYKDVALQIQTLESDIQLADVLKSADEAYDKGDWSAAITAYEALRAVDSTYQSTHVEEQLYQSYINLANKTLEEPVPSLEALQTAEKYFNQALTLRPQDVATLTRRAEVRNTIEERLVNKYLDDAEAALTEDPDSLTALATAKDLFSKALELRPNDPDILVKYQMAVLYLAGIENYNQGNWNDVIDNMNYIITQDPLYAKGTARQALYEAYIARGDNYSAAGEYLEALDDFKQAAILTKGMIDTVTSYFESQTRIADIQGLLGNFEEAVTIYQAAFEESKLRDLIFSKETTLTESLRNAEYTASQADYRASYRLYRQIMDSWASAYDMTIYEVQLGDYLPMLANRYHTTVDAILQANSMTAQIQLQPDTQLNIPTNP